MCQVYSDITFCTCSDFNIDQVEALHHHWVLYRYNEMLNVVIVGENLRMGFGQQLRMIILLGRINLKRLMAVK